MSTRSAVQHVRMRGCDITLHVARAGTGAPVILLHGFPANWSMWHHQIDPLVDAGFSVLAPDLRGYNESDRPEHVEDYGIRMLIDDVAELVRALPERKAHIIGHDWGGVVAWTFSGAYPELIDRLVILNAPHPYLHRRALRKPQQLFRSWYVALFQIPSLAEKLLSADNYKAFRNIFRHSSIRPGTFSEREVDAYVKAASEPGALTAMLNYYRAMREPGAAAIARAARTECETLVVWGERDHALSTVLLNDLEDVAPLVLVKRIPDAGHWVQNEAPDVVSRAIIDFLSAPPTERTLPPQLSPKHR